MCRTSSGCCSNSCFSLTFTELKSVKSAVATAKWCHTILILLGLLAQMTGEALSSAAAAANGHYYQVQRVMSMHNNNSLPFTPSSTSNLLPAGGHEHQLTVTSSAAVGWQQLTTSPRPSAAALTNSYRSVPARTNVLNGTAAGRLSPAASSPSIRHWWTAVFHHHGDQHSSRGGSAGLGGSLRAKRQQMCLHEELGGHDFLSVHGEPDWEDRVCSTKSLNDRVRVLLEALPCPQHRVCQILSPETLRRLAREEEECKRVARDLWKNVFHKLYLMIHDFSDVFQQKFDIGEYSAMHENQRCKEAYTFWTCSTHLPMWLLDPDTNKSVQVEACRSTCLMVEKRCPFLVKGTEDDMASGNPSFICKDDQVPSVVSGTVMPSQCCYSLMLDPLPGQGFPIKVPNGFCHEPDHVQLHLNQSADASGGRPAGHPSAAAAQKDSSSSLPATSLKPHHALSCDKLLWPSASLNVSTSRDAWEWQGWSSVNNSTLSAVVEVDSNLIVALARWLGFDDEFTTEEVVAFTTNQGSAKLTVTGGILVLSWILQLQTR